MKVYIYIDEKDVVMLSGLLDIDIPVVAEDFKIYYTSTETYKSVMVSLTADQFVWLQDQGFLVREELLLN